MIWLHVIGKVTSWRVTCMGGALSCVHVLPVYVSRRVEVHT